MAHHNQKPHILAVETSGRFGSVAIASSEHLVAETLFQKPLQHSAEIFPSINKLLEGCKKKPKDIQHIYISIGPGSFTGLRIAVTLAKSMHLANQTKIVAVNTLDVIAQNANDSAANKIAVILDAKRGQFFVAVYERTNGGSTVNPWQRTSPESLITASEFIQHHCDPAKPIRLLGEGLVYYKDKFKATGIHILDEHHWYPRAFQVHRLGWEHSQKGRFADPVKLTPNYLRKPDAKV